jgi:hypothetical protein
MPVSYLKGLSDYGDQSSIEMLRQSVISWLDFGFITAGAYFNVNLPTSGEYGGDFSRLRYVDAPGYTDGQVWQASRSNFVWESGLGKGTPIDISGVYVGGSLVTTGYSINYPNGTVTFDTPISTASTVQLEHSIKHIQVTDANNIELFRQGQLDSYRVDRFDQAQSGEWAPLSQSRTQLPLIAVDVAPRRTATGYELGNGILNTDTEIVCHIVTETPSDCDRIADILSQQQDSKIYIANINRMADSGITILDYNGDKTNTTMTYPEIVAESSPYRGSACFFTKGSIQERQTLGDAYKRTVRLNGEILV